MEDLLKKLTPWLHILVLIFSAGVAWAGVGAAQDQINKLESRQDRVESAVIDLRISNSRIEEGVKNIERRLNIKRVED